MITCDLMGGLGNQIFQIFATISYAKKTGREFRFLALKQMGGGGSTLRYTFWNTFFKNLKPFLVDSLPPFVLVKQEGFNFKELPLENISADTNVMIHGYFQNCKFFQDHYDEICRLIDLDRMKSELVEKYNLSTQELAQTVSLHFRIGDYKRFSYYHPIMPAEYYIEALKKLQSENRLFRVLFFCEDEDIGLVNETVASFRQLFPDCQFLRGGEGMADWEQMLLMSLCRDNIIANSSFSWWGAYFNSKKDRKVYYPSYWFVSNQDTSDLCPKYWQRVSITPP